MNFNTLYRIIKENDALRAYSCLMLDCAFLQRDIFDLSNRICPCDVYDDIEGHGIEKNPHCTVLYGIHTEKFADILNAVDLKPCSFKIKDISLFSNEKYDVLKLGITSKDLTRLNKQCCESLDYTNAYDDYKAHITVAYLRPGTGKQYTKLKCDLIGHQWQSDTFIFSDKNSNKVYHHC